MEKCSKRTYCDFKENKANSNCEKTKYDNLYIKPAYIGGSCSKSSDCLSKNCVEGKCARIKESCDSTVECPFGEFCNAKTWKIKYPGEQCTSIGWCIDGLCSGKQKEENCTNHTDCVKGYFCNGLYCERQKGENNFCLDQYECLNYLGCHENTCQPYFSLSNGTQLNETNPDKRLCEMNRIDETTNQCAERKYYGVNYDKDLDDGFLKCEIGYNCNYTTGYYHDKREEIEVEPCQCGYSSQGQSYCPIPQDINKKYWDKMYKLMNKRLDNDCHTYRRFECYDELSEKQSDEYYYYQRKTVNAHLFKDASNCIIEVLNSNNMKISVLSLGFIILLLI